MDTPEVFAVTLPTTHTALLVHCPGFLSERPTDKESFVMDWPEAGMLIPWPEGMTAKQAIEAWILGKATDILNGQGL